MRRSPMVPELYMMEARSSRPAGFGATGDALPAPASDMTSITVVPAFSKMPFSRRSPSPRKESVEMKRSDDHADVETLDLAGVGGGSSAAPMLPTYVWNESTPVSTRESTAVSFVDA